MNERDIAKTITNNEILKIIPALNQKVIVDLVNSINVAKSTINVQSVRNPFFTRIFDSITGISAKRQKSINANLANGLDNITNVVSYLIKIAGVSGKVINNISKSLTNVNNNLSLLANFSYQTRKLFEELNDRQEMLEKKINQVDYENKADRHITQEFDAWAAGRYDNFSLSARLYTTLENLNWGDFGSYLRNPTFDGVVKERFLRQIVDKSVIQLRLDLSKIFTTNCPTVKEWYQFPEETLIDAKSALLYLSEYATEKDRPFIHAFSVIDRLPASKLSSEIPRFFKPQRIVQAMAEEVLSKK
ncbi:MAG: YjcZ-like family protein [Deltaproteobacteria bacterium]|jgi:hypothetical protein|nr:YjcZ-like family protein [Deltaproteobacteria bacterium]